MLRHLPVRALAFLPLLAARALEEIPTQTIVQRRHLRYLSNSSTASSGTNQTQNVETDWPVEAEETSPPIDWEEIDEETTNTYFLLNAKPKDEFVCIRPNGDLEDGVQLELTDCADVNTRWRIDSDGLIHTAIDDNFCWQASYEAPPDAAQFIRLFACDSTNTLQQFTFDNTNIKSNANVNVCVTWRGLEADLGGDVQDFLKDIPGISFLWSLPIIGDLIPKGADPIILESCLTTTDTNWTFTA